jgi:hypothetical protein
MPFLASLLCLTSCHRRGFHVASALTPPDGTNASCEGMGPSSTSEPIWLRKHIRAGQRQSSERGRSGNETQVSAVALAAALVAWQVGLAVAQGGRRGRRRWRRRRWRRRRSWRRKFGSGSSSTTRRPQERKRGQALEVLAKKEELRTLAGRVIPQTRPFQGRTLPQNPPTTPGVNR